jgi:hypothetical protein
MNFPGRLIVGGVAAGAALAYYVQRRRARTGESYLDIIMQLPGDAQRWAREAGQRATQALEDGRAAAREREAEIAGELQTAADNAAASATPGG